MTYRNCEECSTPMVTPPKHPRNRPCGPLEDWSEYKRSEASKDTAEMLTSNLRLVCPECLEHCVERLLDVDEEDFEPMLAHYEECLSMC